MKIYQVGGSVRDELLGLDPKDIDYVVVGATPADMEALGYQQVGADFPVFLHPVTGDEYALARTERKTGVGYAGFETEFDPTITLEDDLIRRDLTINSMAKDPVTGEIIDPFNGRADLEAGILRATSYAFAEDPVRVLRTARFAARYGFIVAADTVQLMREIAHEIQFVPQERVWAEMQKGLMEKNPHLMFEVLQHCGALKIGGPLHGYHQINWKALSEVGPEHGLEVRFALIAGFMHREDYSRLCIPSDCSHLSGTYNEMRHLIDKYFLLGNEERLSIFIRTRAIHQGELLRKMLQVFRFNDTPETTSTVTAIWMDLERLRGVDAGAIAKSCSDPKTIQPTIKAAYIAALV